MDILPQDLKVGNRFKKINANVDIFEVLEPPIHIHNNNLLVKVRNVYFRRKPIFKTVVDKDTLVRKTSE